LGKKLFAAGSVGLDGWMFADLLEHEYIMCVASPVRLTQMLPLLMPVLSRSDKHVSRAPGETTVVPTKQTLAYVPLSLALGHSFANTKKRELKRTGTVLWGVLGASASPASLGFGVPPRADAPSFFPSFSPLRRSASRPPCAYSTFVDRGLGGGALAVGQEALARARRWRGRLAERGDQVRRSSSCHPAAGTLPSRT